MKRILSIFLTIALCIFCFVACGGDDDNNKNGKENKNAKQLSAPVVTKGEGVATWEKVENASGYEISINKNIISVDANTTSYPLHDNEVLKVRAVGDGKNYKTSEWSNSVFISIELPDDEFE